MFDRRRKRSDVFTLKIRDVFRSGRLLAHRQLLAKPDQGQSISREKNDLSSFLRRSFPSSEFTGPATPLSCSSWIELRRSAKGEVDQT